MPLSYTKSLQLTPVATADPTDVETPKAAPAESETPSLHAALVASGASAASIVLPSLTVRDDASSTHATTGSEPPEMPTPISAVEPSATAAGGPLTPAPSAPTTPYEFHSAI